MSTNFDRRRLRPLMLALALALCAFQIGTSTGLLLLEPLVVRAVHVGLVLILVFLWRAPRAEQRRHPGPEPWPILLIDAILMGVSTAATAYIVLNAADIQDRMPLIDEVTPLQFGLGAGLILAILEATRRTAGSALVLVALAALVYAFAGHVLPGNLGHLHLEGMRIVESLYLLNDGIWGTSTGASATIIYVFILFGSMLDKTGMSSVFLELACLATRRARGGPAKASIFGSALFGSVSGSAAANVYATGTFTIPLMKRVGYRSEFAGAVEAVASSGGLIMPPVMGSIAFVMAEYTGIGYLAICKAALLPALLYYAGLFTMIHFEALRCDLGGTPADLIPPKGEIAKKIYYLFPLILLIGIMMSGRSIIFSALMGCLSILVLSCARGSTRLTVRRFLSIVEDAAANLLMIAACCACVGIIIGVVTMTGFGFGFVSMMGQLAHVNLGLFLLALMLTCIVFGMGLPALPAYILVATFGAPALVQAGIPPVSAHLFVMYFAVVSGITPPVCLVAYAGASIAEASPMKTGVTAFKLGIAAYLIPFFFIFEPALLLMGSPAAIIPAVITSLLGTVCIASGMQARFLVESKPVERALLFGAGLVLVYPGLLTDLMGLTLIVLAALPQWLRRRSAGDRDPATCLPGRSRQSG